MTHFEAWARAAAPDFAHNQSALCAASAMPPMALSARGAPQPRPPRPTVLVVEDEPLIRILLCDLLEDAGLDVEDAADADHALERLSSIDSDRRRCRVLVTDVNLGRGLDGIALAARARRAVPGLHVVYVTGTPERVLASRRTPLPRERVLGKPFHNAELVATVRGLAASAAARGD